MRERYELIDTIHALEAELSAIDAALGFDDGSTRSAGDRVERIGMLRGQGWVLMAQGTGVVRVPPGDVAWWQGQGWGVVEMIRVGR